MGLDSSDQNINTYENNELECELLSAMKIDGKWAKCQRLAQIAWRADDQNTVARVTKLALEIAYSIDEPYNKVAVSAWILKAMVKGNLTDLEPIIQGLVETIAQEPNPICRGHALLFLFEAIYSEHSLRKAVLQPLLVASSLMRSWRQPRIYHDISLIMAIDDVDNAKKIAELITDPSIKRKTLKRIKERYWLGPHEFFPHYKKLNNAKG